MFNRRALLILPFIGLTAVACDDSTSPESQQLTASEAAALALALDNSSSSAVEPAADANGPSLSQVPLNEPAVALTSRTDAFNLELPCPRGGTATLSGEHVLVIDTDEGFVTVDVTASRDHDGCGFRTKEGVDITVDGTLEFVAERELRAGLVSASQSHTGSLDYTTSDGKQGTCVIDISTAFTLIPGEATRTILGSVCGHSVDVSTTWAHTE